MAKVLKITKPDSTIHVVPLVNKSRLESFNKRQKADKKWTLEVIDEADAKNLPYKDPNYVSAGDAVKKLTEKDAEISEKDAEIEKLKALLKAAEEKDAAEENENAFDENDLEAEHEDSVEDKDDFVPPVVDKKAVAKKKTTPKKKA